MPDVQTAPAEHPIITLPKTVKEEYGDAIEKLNIDEGSNYLALIESTHRAKVLMYIKNKYKDSDKKFTTRTVNGKIYLFRIQ